MRSTFKRPVKPAALFNRRCIRALYSIQAPVRPVAVMRRGRLARPAGGARG